MVFRQEQFKCMSAAFLPRTDVYIYAAMTVMVSKSCNVSPAVQICQSHCCSVRSAREAGESREVDFFWKSTACDSILFFFFGKYVCLSFDCDSYAFCLLSLVTFCVCKGCEPAIKMFDHTEEIWGIQYLWKHVRS